MSIALAIPAQSLNVAFLVALAFAIAASANLPVILFSLFWKRFNTSGATWGIYGGLCSALVLLAFSPNVSGGAVNATTGKAASLFSDPAINFSWFPLNNPGLVSIPLGLPVRLCRGDHQQGIQQGEVGRDGGPFAHRRACREGNSALRG